MNKETVSTLSLKVKDQRHDFRNLKLEMREKHDDFGKRIRLLEDWKLVFVTKFSTYVAISLFLGSIVSQVLITYFKSLFT